VDRVFLEPVQLDDLRAGQDILEPFPVAERRQVERPRADLSDAVLVEVVVVTVRDEDHLHGGELLGLQRKRRMPVDEINDVPEYGIRQDVLAVDPDPERGMPQVGDGVLRFQDGGHVGLRDGEVGPLPFFLPEGVGADLPLQEPQDAARLLFRHPGVAKARVGVMGPLARKRLDILRLTPGRIGSVKSGRQQESGSDQCR